MSEDISNPIISFQMENAGSFQKAVGVLDSLIEEGTFRFSEEGIELREINNTRTCLIQVKIPYQEFQDVKEGQAGMVYLRIDDLKKFLSLIDKDSSMWVSLGKTFCMQTDRKKVQVPIQDYEAPEPPAFPVMPFDTSATVYIGDLQRVLRDFSKIYENVRMISRLGGDHSAKSWTGLPKKSEKASDVIEFQAGDDLEGKLTEMVETLSLEGSGSAIYSIHYMSNALRGVHKDIAVKLEWGNDLPVRMIYVIEGPPNIEVTVFLAPRVEE